MSKFERLGLGGTFDRLHTGHELILDLASFYSQHIQIGLISAEYLQARPKIFGNYIQSFYDRTTALKNYLNSRNRACSIVKIDTIGKDRQIASESDLTALLVSQETFLGALAINNKRKMQKKPPLVIILSPIVISNNGTKLSSSKIREELFENKS